MDFDQNLQATLVFDGSDTVVVPSQMGTPRDDQMVGTPGERLSELALRICYDSMGIQPDGTKKKSRSSVEAHKHIIEVGHLSVFEHYNFTVELTPYKPGDKILATLVNRPGIWMQQRDGALRLTMNLRCLMDWETWSCSCPQEVSLAANVLGAILKEICAHLAPNILGEVTPERAELRKRMALDSLKLEDIRLVEPEGEEECWISMFMSGSRGFSHELVRHGDRTAISQRSTRYVDEGGNVEKDIPASPWILHPLTAAYLAADWKELLPADPKTDFDWEAHTNGIRKQVMHQLLDVEDSACDAYRTLVKHLESFLKNKGVDSGTARKQARGAARGYLGNALCTEVIFSASVGQWRHMLKMRAANAADAEIRVVFAKAAEQLKASKYGKFFNDIELQPAADGLGTALADGGHK